MSFSDFVSCEKNSIVRTMSSLSSSKESETVVMMAGNEEPIKPDEKDAADVTW